MPEISTHGPLWLAPRAGRWLLPLAALCLSPLLSAPAQAQGASAAQRSTAEQVARAGVPLAELAPNAPESHTVKPGDTLWSIAALFLKKPWRWPELWGMNLQQIANPNRIFPGQVLVLQRGADGRATLAMKGAPAPAASELQTVKLSPRVRAESLADAAIAPIPLNVIEPFLAEPLVVDEAAFARAPRLVASIDGRSIMARGDRAYARSTYGIQDADSSLGTAKGQPRDFRVFRHAVALRDPANGEVLAFEAQFIGKVSVARGEGLTEGTDKDGKPVTEVVPATVDVVLAKEELRAGDRLLPEPPREVPNYVPRAPATAQSGQVVSVHGSAVRYAGQNQIVVINRGERDGVARGHVLAILKDRQAVVDRTDPAQPTMRLPAERNGLMMVFRTFERVSYALVLQITDGVKVGDRFANP